MRMLTIIFAFLGVVLLLVAITAVRAARHATKAPAADTPAPDFTLNAQDGKPLSLRDFRGRWVVLYFYPKDFTGGCTKEARNFQHDLALYEQKNAVILGVSGQDEVSHEKFCAAEGLHFKLLADPHCELSAVYGSVAFCAPHVSHRSRRRHSQGVSEGRPFQAQRGSAHRFV